MVVINHGSEFPVSDSEIITKKKSKLKNDVIDYLIGIIS